MKQNPSLRDSDRNGGLGRRLVAEMNGLTLARHGDLALENMARNRDFMDRGQSLAALRGEQIGEGNSAIVIAAGPSVHRHDPLSEIKQSGYSGAIVATESAMAYCLRNGVVPDLVVTLDPHATRIVRWFGDPSLTQAKLGKDDYFARQDMDPAFADELRVNDELLALLAEHGHKIRIALSTSASAAVVDRVLESGMRIYWWNPMLDDPDEPDSVTARIQQENKMPSMNAGGNVGTACWMMAGAALGKRHVALSGMDFSYYGDTPYFNTQYYHEAVALVGEENLDSLYMRIHNPYLDAEFYTDPAYMWYRECFLEIAADPEWHTYNCTEGGILFGDGIDFIPLSDFLNRFTGTSRPED